MPALELPSWSGSSGDRLRVLEILDSWAGSPELASIVAAFGDSIPAVSGDERLNWIEGFASSRWDFRKGGERNSISQSGLTSAQTGIVFSCAFNLGLSDREVPTATRYDTVIMTGGMVRSGIVKPRFVAQLLEAGLRCDHIVFLGGFRAFSGDEAVLAAALGVSADNEFAAMRAGLEFAFGALGEPQEECGSGGRSNSSWSQLSWSPKGLPRLSVLAAPSSEPRQRRANSADTYRFWAENRRTPAERSVLQVTTPIYVPYQAAAAVSILGLDFGLEVETVGVSAAASDLGELSQPFLAEHHLQELRAAIGAMRGLHRRLVAGEGRSRRLTIG